MSRRLSSDGSLTGVILVKAALIVALLAVVAGGALGSGLGYRDYGQVKSHFGPFRTDEEVTIEAVREMLAKRESGAVPQLEIVGANPFDFGVMRRNASAKHKFVLKNAGDAPLELEVTGSTCKCTVGTLKDTVLEPGESTEVELEWTAKTGVGSFGQSANLKTNDPLQGEVSLGVNGRVIDVVAAEPAAWNLGDVAATEPIELKTTIFNHASDKITISKIQWLDETFAGLSEIRSERRELTEEEAAVHKEAVEAFDVLVSIKPQLAQGSLNKRLRIEYESDGDEEVQPAMELVLTGRIVGELSVLGGSKLSGAETGDYRLVLGQVDVGKVLEEKIYVIVRGPKRDSVALKVGSVDPENAIEVEIGSGNIRGDMKVVPVIVRTKADAPEMVRGGQVDAKPGKITLETDDPEVAPIAIDVLFRIGKSF